MTSEALFSPPREYLQGHIPPTPVFNDEQKTIRFITNENILDEQPFKNSKLYRLAKQIVQIGIVREDEALNVLNIEAKRASLPLLYEEVIDINNILTKALGVTYNTIVFDQGLRQFQFNTNPETPTALYYLTPNKVGINGHTLKMPPKEGILFQILMAHSGVVTIDELEQETRLERSQINTVAFTLRKKLSEALDNQDILRNVHNIGFVIDGLNEHELQRQTESIQYGGYTMYPERFRVEYNGQGINLSPTEFMFLEANIRHPEFISHDFLSQFTYNQSYSAKHNDIAVTYINLKRKLPPSAPIPVQLRGQGFRLSAGTLETAQEDSGSGNIRLSDITQEIIFPNDERISLSQIEYTIIDKLQGASANTPVDRDELSQIFPHHELGESNDDKIRVCIGVHLNTLKKKLAPHGYTIKNIRRTSIERGGWYLELLS